jgi:hypothetical protein
MGLVDFEQMLQEFSRFVGTKTFAYIEVYFISVYINVSVNQKVPKSSFSMYVKTEQK